MRYRALALATAFVACILIACGNPLSEGATTVRVQGVKVTPQVLQFAAAGDTARIVATVAPANATDKLVTWNSTDPLIASVDNTGLVTARAIGVGVFVTATTHDGMHQASVNVSVSP